MAWILDSVIIAWILDSLEKCGNSLDGRDNSLDSKSLDKRDISLDSK